jgi:hypothetical protein
MYNPKPSLTIIPTQCTIARDDEGHGGIGAQGVHYSLKPRITCVHAPY